jgi:hypothetical protein
LLACVSCSPLYIWNMSDEETDDPHSCCKNEYMVPLPQSRRSHVPCGICETLRIIKSVRIGILTGRGCSERRMEAYSALSQFIATSALESPPHSFGLELPIPLVQRESENEVAANDFPWLQMTDKRVEEKGV